MGEDDGKDEERALLLAHRQAQRLVYVCVASAIASAVYAAFYRGSFADHWRWAAGLAAFTASALAIFFSWRARSLKKRVTDS
ncbi:MAG: hypothetical protein KC619_26820 [Myxococcales bacterium]|nr:hypothetical protein [Myxococcales bacterium]